MFVGNIFYPLPIEIKFLFNREGCFHKFNIGIWVEPFLDHRDDAYEMLGDDKERNLKK